MKKFSMIIFMVVLIAGGLVASRVLAMPDTTTIAANCATAQAILNQIEKADTGSRINRGHDYNELLDLMFAMNARLSANRIAAPTLVDMASNFRQNIAAFRSNYDKYSDALSNARNVKCADKPAEFYDRLESTRAARALLKQNVMTLGQNIEDYYNEFNAITKAEGR